MADVVAFLDDLFFQAKIRETAKQLGIDIRFCSALDAFTAEIAANKPKLVVADLNARANAFGALAVARAEAARVPTVAFLSHLQTDLAERARAIEGVEVMPRSKFTRDLATILARAKSQS
jgi:hypothetical protein